MATNWKRITCTLPVIDIDGALWTLWASDPGPDAEVAIQICEGFDFGPQSDTYRSHEYDGKWHEGDMHLFLDNDAAHRLLSQLRNAFDHREHHAAARKAKPFTDECRCDACLAAEPF